MIYIYSFIFYINFLQNVNFLFNIVQVPGDNIRGRRDMQKLRHVNEHPGSLGAGNAVGSEDCFAISGEEVLTGGGRIDEKQRRVEHETRSIEISQSTGPKGNAAVQQVPVHH